MKKYIILFSAIVFLFSCKKSLLDIPQQGVLPTGSYYTSADDETVLSFISAIYYQIRGNIASPTGTNIGKTNSALSVRNILEKMGGDFGESFEFIETASGDTYSYLWSYYYTIIYWSNMIIENLPNNHIASDPVKNQVISEARAIRAIMMMNLVQLFGNPPLADHIMNGTEDNTPAQDSWTFINNELAEAAEALPSKSGKGGQAAIGGRLTKEAAYAYLGKAFLWQKDYVKAAQVLHDKVIATNLYELNPDFRELNRYTSDFGDENLWEYEITNQGDYVSSQAGFFDVAYIGWPGDKFSIPDGIFADQGWGNTSFPSESFGFFMANHDIVNGNETQRYQGTLATYEDLLTKFTYQDQGGNKGLKTSLEKCEGYFRVRMTPRNENLMGSGGWSRMYMQNNVCYMRYAEVLLNYAEAVANGGTNGSSLTGLAALNQVRERAGLGDAPSLDMNNLQYGVKAERRAELNWEGIRFIDLVRWGDAPTALADAGKTMPVFFGYNNSQNATPQSKAEWKITRTVMLGQGFKAGKNELFPIPTVERQSNPNLIQNPGW